MGRRIWIDQYFVTDERADIGSLQSVKFHTAWMSNGSDLAEAKVTVNGTEYTTNQTGWITFETTFDKVGRLIWKVTDIKYENLNLFANPSGFPSIIWDRIKINEQKTFEQIIQSGSQQIIWLTAEYEYDSTPFDDSKGKIFLNYKPMTWSTENQRWEQTITSNQTGLEQYKATSVNDHQGFKLKTINQAAKINITWDQIEITNTKIETTQPGKTKIKFDVNFEYTKNPITNSEVILNGLKCEQINQKTYTCTLDNWSPIQGAQISIEYMNFNQYKKNLSIIHISNTVLYIAIVSAIILSILFLIKRRKNKTQKTKPNSLT